MRTKTLERKALRVNLPLINVVLSDADIEREKDSHRCNNSAQDGRCTNVMSIYCGRFTETSTYICPYVQTSLSMPMRSNMVYS